MVSFIRQTDSEGNYQMVCGLEDVNASAMKKKQFHLHGSLLADMMSQKISSVTPVRSFREI